MVPGETSRGGMWFEEILFEGANHKITSKLPDEMDRLYRKCSYLIVFQLLLFICPIISQQKSTV